MKKSCPHCAPFEPKHTQEWLDFFAESVTLHLERFFTWIRIPEKLNDLVFSALIRMFCLLRLADYKPTNESNLVGAEKQKLIISEALRRGHSVSQFHLLGRPTNTFMVNGRLVDQIPQKNSAKPQYNQLDDKPSFLVQAERHGLPTPKSCSFFFLKQALVYASKIRYPVVVKPSRGSLSKHTIYPIRNENELIFAFRIAKQISPVIMVEKYISGHVHRITLVNGAVVAACKRLSASDQGNGEVTHKELVEKQQNNKLLEKLGVRIHDLTEELHLDNKKILEDFASQLGGVLIGFDLIAEDLSQSWQNQEFALIEANSFPAIAMHYNPDQGKTRDVASLIWDCIDQDEMEP